MSDECPQVYVGQRFTKRCPKCQTERTVEVIKHDDVFVITKCTHPGCNTGILYSSNPVVEAEMRAMFGNKSVLLSRKEDGDQKPN